jgi:hypothetical protein
MERGYIKIKKQIAVGFSQRITCKGRKALADTWPAILAKARIFISSGSVH